MQAKAAKRVLLLFVVLLSMILTVGCTGMKKATVERLPGYLYYPSELVDADQALNEAREAGKDKECPTEFNAAKAMVDKAYEIYMSCRNKEAIATARDAMAMIKALCPPKPVVEKVCPEPIPAPPPPPAPAPAPVKIILEDIHFDFDKATLTATAKEILAKDIATLKANAGITVQIEGHCDAYGTEEYNMALGERRANAVKEYLANEGIEAGRMTTISYGKTRLLCEETPTGKNKNSTCMKENRRVHFEIIVK